MRLPDISDLALYRLTVGLTIFFLFIISFILTYAYFTYRGVYVGSQNFSGLFAKPSPTPSASPEPPVYTIALLGHGDPGHEGGLLTDSIMVIRVDTGKKRIGIISVPRDLWVTLPSNGYANEEPWKINAAYAIGSDDRNYRNKPSEFTGAAGGGEMSKLALQRALGFPVQNFVALNFTGFKKSIDVLGGVEVNVTQAFEDDQYPIPGLEEDVCGKTPEDMAATTATLSATLLEKEFTCRYELLHFDKGKQLMDGETALKYVRSRHSAQSGGDFNRAARQRAVLLAVKDKVLRINFLPKAIPFISKLTANLKTDIPLSQLQTGVDQYQEFTDYEIRGVALTTDANSILKLGVSSNGQSILMPKTGEGDWASVHAWVQEQLNASASAKLQSTPLKPSPSLAPSP